MEQTLYERVLIHKVDILPQILIIPQLDSSRDIDSYCSLCMPFYDMLEDLHKFSLRKFPGSVLDCINIEGVEKYLYIMILLTQVLRVSSNPEIEVTKENYFWCHSQPQTHQTPDTSNPRHIKPQTLQT